MSVYTHTLLMYKFSMSRSSSPLIDITSLCAHSTCIKQRVSSWFFQLQLAMYINFVEFEKAKQLFDISPNNYRHGLGIFSVKAFLVGETLHTS